MDGGTLLLLGAFIAGTILLVYVLITEDMNRLVRSLTIAFTAVFVLIVAMVLIYQTWGLGRSDDDDDGGRSVDYLSLGMNTMMSILPLLISKGSTTAPVAESLPQTLLL